MSVQALRTISLCCRGFKVTGRALEWEKGFGSWTDIDSSLWSIIYNLWDLEPIGELQFSVQRTTTTLTTTTYQSGRVLVIKSGNRHKNPMWVNSQIHVCVVTSVSSYSVWNSSWETNSRVKLEFWGELAAFLSTFILLIFLRNKTPNFIDISNQDYISQPPLLLLAVALFVPKFWLMNRSRYVHFLVTCP